MYENQKAEVANMAGSNALGLIGPRVMNPTLRENIDIKIQHYRDEIERLEKIKAKLSVDMLDMNLRDLREAFQF